MSVASESAAAGAVVSPGWLRSRSFDVNFIVGIAALALASGYVVVLEPSLFLPILVADLWLLGYHHVIATFTRLCFDRESFHQHKFLVLGLPPIIVFAVAAMAIGVGMWTLATVYLYWQWFHYTRQSWGVSQVYRRKAGGIPEESPWLAKSALYLLPLWGILHRSHQDPGTFLGLELKVLPVPEIAVQAAAVAAIASIAWWLMLRVRMWREGRLPLAHTLYVLSHFVVFYAGYIAIENITFGWLVINVWHNAQYIAFVWMYNNKRFKSGVDHKARFLSFISQERNSWLYLVVCLGISTSVYLVVENAVAALPMVVVIYQAINFHHYVVDGVIWKVRRKSLQKTLGIAA